MDIAQVLTKRFPDSEWTLNGDSYSGLTWLSAGKNNKAAVVAAASGCSRCWVYSRSNIAAVKSVVP